MGRHPASTVKNLSTASLGRSRQMQMSVSLGFLFVALFEEKREHLRTNWIIFEGLRDLFLFSYHFLSIRPASRHFANKIVYCHWQFCPYYSVTNWGLTICYHMLPPLQISFLDLEPRVSHMWTL